MKLKEMMSQREKREFKQKELEQEIGQEATGSPNARWVKDPGPNKVGGFEFQKETPSGWKTVGFVKTADKPKRYHGGKMKMYDGKTGKDITVDVGEYYITDEGE